MSWPYKPFKIVNNTNPGTADIVGGDDNDKMAGYLNNQSDAHLYTYYVYIDADSGDYMARNGQTGQVDFTEASDVSALLTSILGAIPNPGDPTVIRIGPGNFNMTTNFATIDSTFLGNIAILGSGIGITNLIVTSSITTGSVFSVLGAVSGSSNNLTSNALAGDTTVAVTNGAAFTAGDTVLLRSSAAFSTATSAQGNKGEIHKIVSIATNTLTLDHWTHDAYATADTANVIKLGMLRDITIQDLSLKAGAGYTGTGKFFEFRYTDNLRLNRVHVQNSLSTGMYLDSCINYNLDVVLEQTPTATFNSQYGLRVGCASENGTAKILGMGRWRHLTTIDATGTANLEGQVRNCEFSGIGETTDEAVWDCHATGENITFRNCHVNASRSNAAGTNNARCFQIRAKGCKLIGCTVIEGVGEGITLSEDASGTVISGCNIKNIRELPGNNTLGYGIEIRTGVNNCVITGNYIENTKRDAILIRSTSSGHVITGNMINAAQGDAIDSTDTSDCVVSGNRITGCGGKAINMGGTGDYWVIVGNSMRGNTASNTTTGANIVVANNTTT